MRPASLSYGTLALVVLLAGCQGHSSSPWEFGPGIWIAPGFAAGNGDVTVHPKISYSMLFFDGGKDHLIELGGQVRTPLAGLHDQFPGFWIGGEGNVSRLSTKYDSSDFGDDSANGWSLWALAGAPVGESRWGVHLYGGGGISHYGGGGVNVRLGVDLQPWFLER